MQRDCMCDLFSALTMCCTGFVIMDICICSFETCILALACGRIHRQVLSASGSSKQQQQRFPSAQACARCTLLPTAIMLLLPLQVGAQDVAMGVKFSAACTLEIQEYPTGIPDGLCTVDGNWDYYFPRPWGGSSSNDSTSASVSSMSSMEVDVWRDISFSAVEGDFKVGWAGWLA